MSVDPAKSTAEQQKGRGALFVDVAIGMAIAGWCTVLYSAFVSPPQFVLEVLVFGAVLGPFIVAMQMLRGLVLVVDAFRHPLWFAAPIATAVTALCLFGVASISVSRGVRILGTAAVAGLYLGVVDLLKWSLNIPFQ